MSKLAWGMFLVALWVVGTPVAAQVAAPHLLGAGVSNGRGLSSAACDEPSRFAVAVTPNGQLCAYYDLYNPGVEPVTVVLGMNLVDRSARFYNDQPHDTSCEISPLATETCQRIFEIPHDTMVGVADIYMAIYAPDGTQRNLAILDGAVVVYRTVDATDPATFLAKMQRWGDALGWTVPLLVGLVAVVGSVWMYSYQFRRLERPHLQFVDGPRSDGGGIRFTIANEGHVAVGIRRFFLRANDGKADHDVPLDLYDGGVVPWRASLGEAASLMDVVLGERRPRTLLAMVPRDIPMPSGPVKDLVFVVEPIVGRPVVAAVEPTWLGGRKENP